MSIHNSALSVFAPSKASHKKRRSCTLMITRRCNLNCSYCYESHKCNDTAFDMTFDTAKRILLSEFTFVQASSDFDEIEIDFMGGEPFMNFPLIKQVVEWLDVCPPPIPYICFATTNGTLIEEYKDWLFKHRKRFILGGSFDGTNEMQKTNRGSREGMSVNIKLLHTMYPDQGIHMTVSKETLPHLSVGVLSLQRKGFRVEVALAQGIDWNISDAAEYERQLEGLAMAYLTTDRRLKPINLLSRYLGGIDGNHESIRQKKYCGSGTHMVAYDYDGKAYGCHLFTPIVLGEGAKVREDIPFLCPEVVEDGFCSQCVLKSTCPTCAGFNYRYRGSIGIRDHRWCKLMLVQYKMASIFQQKYVAAMEHPSIEDVRYLRAAVKAYEVISASVWDEAPFRRVME